MRFRDWPRENSPPELGDIAAQTVLSGSDPYELLRAYEIVGIIETRTGGYRLVMERVEFARYTDREADLALGNPIPPPPHLLRDRLHEEWSGLWTFYNLPR
jgi:hypothetical protein